MGDFLIILSLILGVISFTMYYFTYSGYTNTLKVARNSFYLMTLTVAVASLFLLYLIITHNYEYNYVYEFSNNELSLGLLLSTFYAGQEGSFLLWLLFSTLIGLILIKKEGNSDYYEASLMLPTTLIIVFLTIMISPYLKNPFEMVWSNVKYLSIDYFNKNYLNLPFLQKFIFTNKNMDGKFVKVSSELVALLKANSIDFKDFLISGKGLNPLLQNFWMQIHPPLLFVGFALAEVPFIYSISSLLRNEYKSWVSKLIPWLSVGMLILGLAIMIGGYWAYGVLGWGGYWGWDPVENSSLVPWILGISLLHTLLIQKKYIESRNGKFVKTNIILAALTFLSVLYSTFLTRSGILSDSSVHSFVAPGMATYIFLCSFILLFFVGTMIMVIKKWKYIVSDKSEIKIISRESGLFYGSIVLIGMAIIISVGTSAPIWGNSVEISFYNIMNLPLAIISSVLIGITIFLPWGKKTFNFRSITFISSIVLSILLALSSFFLLGLNGILNFLLYLASIFAIISNLVFVIKNKDKIINLGGKIAHIGIGILFIGILLNGLLKETKDIDLVKGEKTEVFNKELTFRGYRPFDKGRKFYFDIDVKDNINLITASPVMYKSSYNDGLMREPYIINGWLTDYYISPTSYDEGSTKAESNFNNIILHKGVAKTVEGYELVFSRFVYTEKDMSNMMKGDDYSFGAEIRIKLNKKEYIATPSFIVKSGKKEYVNFELKELDAEVELLKIDASGTVIINLNFKNKKDYNVKKEVLKANISKESFITLVWLGTIITAIGLLFSYLNRRKVININ